MQRAAIADVRLAQNDVTFNCSNTCLFTALRRDPTFFFTKVIGDQSCVQKSESLRACACVLFFLCPPTPPSRQRCVRRPRRRHNRSLRLCARRKTSLTIVCSTWARRFSLRHQSCAQPQPTPTSTSRMWPEPSASDWTSYHGGRKRRRWTGPSHRLPRGRSGATLGGT